MSSSTVTSRRNSKDIVIRKVAEEEDAECLTTTVPVFKPQGCCGARHVLSFMGFLGISSLYAMRVNLSVAIVAMVNNTAIPHANKTVADECPAPGDNSTDTQKDGEFVWTESEQGLILGSFFWGYIVTNMLGGRLGEVIGGKIVFGIGVLVTSVLTLVTPVVAQISTPLLIALRVVEGLGEGVTFPAMFSLLAKWIPPFERSKTVAFVYAGVQFGTVVSLPISGLLCQSDFLGGWPAVFYMFGVLGIVWFIGWMVLIHNTPETHPRISLEEKIYIQTSLNQTPSRTTSPAVPWIHILTSVPFWAILVVNVAMNWGFYTLLTELPTYMKNVLHFSIADNSFMSALPYLVMWIFGNVCGRLADFLCSNGMLSTVNTRRIFSSIGSYGPMVAIVLVGYAGCNKQAAVGLLSAAVGLSGASFAGFLSSFLDLSPNFAGTLVGISNTAGTIPGFLAPIITGMLISGQDTVSRWQLVFWIAAIVYFVGNTVYVIFISGEQQPWNDLEEDRYSQDKSRLISETAVGQYGSFGNPSSQDTSTEGLKTPSDIPEIC